MQSYFEKQKVYQEIREAIGMEPFLSYLVLSREEANQNRYIYLDMLEDVKILYEQDNFFSKRLERMRARLKELGSKKVYLEDGTWYWDLKPDLRPGEVFTL